MKRSDEITDFVGEGLKFGGRVRPGNKLAIAEEIGKVKEVDSD